jgi:inorganic pyrophosphatase
VPATDYDNGSRIQTLDDLGEVWKQKIDYHFSTYKDLRQKGTTKVLGFGDAKDAIEVIEECIERYENK